MSNAFFYVFIYFLGYYGSNVLNMLTVRPLITNRFVAALVPVYGFAFTHAYMIVNKAPPPGITTESAILFSVVTPLVLVTVGAIYFMWRSKDKQDEDLTEVAQSNIDQQAAEARTAEIPEQEAQASEKSELSDTKQSSQDSNRNKTQN
ncbi:MAG: hypothetical protein ABL887_03825 [Nitrosomonas sp.]|jgi:nitrogen fixation-related uncharacterized protein